MIHIQSVGPDQAVRQTPGIAALLRSQLDLDRRPQHHDV